MIESQIDISNNKLLPNIRYPPQNETDNMDNYISKDFNKINKDKLNIIEKAEDGADKQIIDNNYNDLNDDNIDNKNIPLEKESLVIKSKEKEKDNKIFLPNIMGNEGINNFSSRYVKRNYSQFNLMKNKYHLNASSSDIYSIGEFSKFLAKIKISNFYSTSEIILLAENIINELNLKKDYTFIVKDSFITFIFNDAEEGLILFKKLNLTKLKNKYYQNLLIDINFELKEDTNAENEKRKIPKVILKEEKIFEKKGGEEEKGKKMKIKIKKLAVSQKKRNKKLESFKNIKTYNYSKDNLYNDSILSDKNFEVIYKKYLEYFGKRKEERRKRELNYTNGKNISLQASMPFKENNNLFLGNLRKYKGNDVAPSRFEGFIDKASVKEGNYKDNHLYEVPDFKNHWKLRENNNDKKKWISPVQFHI